MTIVFNNGAYGNVRRDQQRLYQGREIASDLPQIDYVQLAQAQGVKATRVRSPEELVPALRQAIDADEPALIEVLVDPDTEVPPWPFILRQG